MRRRIGVVLVGVLVTAVSAGHGQDARDTLRVGGLRVARGTVRTGDLVLPARGADSALAIPVTVAHGAAPGPVVAVLAGIHGAEYAPIIAAQRIRPLLDPTTMRGSVVLVQLANPPAFYGRSAYYVPGDGRNLNRVFPGDSTGSLAERMAALLTREVISHADALIDVHAGDAPEALAPHVYAPVTGDTALDARAFCLALSTGLDPVVPVRRARRLPGTASLTTTGLGAALGIPTLTTEAGQLGLVEEATVARSVAAVLGGLRGLGVLAGPGRFPRAEVVDSAFSISAPASGIWEAAVRPGQQVRAGQVLGRITDHAGVLRAEVRASAPGRVLSATVAPPIRAGEALVYVVVKTHRTEAGRARECDARLQARAP